MGFTSLNHYIDLRWLHVAYHRTRKDGATGVDGQTATEYEQDLLDNLRSLLDQAKSGTYQAPPVRRVHIPKRAGSPETRPIGIPTFEDKILGRAVVMVLEPIYEQDFYDCSYGFRPGRSPHQALAVLWQQMMTMGGGWILEVDIRKFFDTLDHSHLRALLRKRVRDGVLLRLIGKWLKAGVMENGMLWHPELGSPQGSVVSPILSNIYLHYVLDEWFDQEVRSHLRGRAWLIRFADDFVMGFSHEDDARRVLRVLPKRFGKYGLTIHPEKTRLVAFHRPDRWSSTSAPLASRPGTFDFLGFTHYWGKSRKGTWVIKRKTASNRLSRALTTIAEWCRRHRHWPIAEQHATLSQKLRGHYAYYGITGNCRALQSFAYEVRRIWRKWLSRRSWASPLSWEQYERVLQRYPLPTPRIVRSASRRAANP